MLSVLEVCSVLVCCGSSVLRLQMCVLFRNVDDTALVPWVLTLLILS
jgi:hypothetical protein